MENVSFWTLKCASGRMELTFHQQAPEGADAWAVCRKDLCYSIVPGQEKLSVKADPLELN